MAKVQFGSGVAAITGRTAGTVFARNKGGAYIRRFSKPINPSTQAQVNARNRLATQSASWRLLDLAEQLAWNAWALTHPVLDRLGASIVLTGHQAYVKILTVSDLMGDNLNNGEPPADPAYPDMGYLGTFADCDEEAIVLTEIAANPATAKFALYAAPPVSAGITNVVSKMRFLGALVGTNPVANAPKDITTLYTAKFGNLTGQVGKRIVVEIWPYSNGQFERPLQIVGTVAAGGP